MQVLSASAAAFGCFGCLGAAFGIVSLKHGSAFGLLGSVLYAVYAFRVQDQYMAISSAVGVAVWGWLWWHHGGGDDTKRRLRRLAEKFQPTRRTAPSGA